MKRLLLVVPLLAAVLATACSPRFTLFTTWTVDGASAKGPNGDDGACAALDAAKVRFRAENSDIAGGTVTEETSTAQCADGKASLQVGGFSTVYLDLVSGDETFGGAGPIAVTPATSDDGSFLGDSAENPLAVDLSVKRGHLVAHLTVVGESCADAGASEFIVTLRRNTSPLGREIIEENKTVACEDGDAVFTAAASVEVGSVYEVVATTSIDGVDYTTGDGAQGGSATVDGLVNVMNVDLDVVGRP